MILHLLNVIWQWKKVFSGILNVFVDYVGYQLFYLVRDHCACFSFVFDISSWSHCTQLVYNLSLCYMDSFSLITRIGVEHMPDVNGRSDSRGQSTSRFPGKVPRWCFARKSSRPAVVWSWGSYTFQITVLSSNKCHVNFYYIDTFYMILLCVRRSK